MIFKLEREALTPERMEKLLQYQKVDLIGMEEDLYVFRCTKKMWTK